jgi:hypothetical protein
MDETIPEFRRVLPATCLNTGPDCDSSQARQEFKLPSGRFEGSPFAHAARHVSQHILAVCAAL